MKAVPGYNVWRFRRRAWAASYLGGTAYTSRFIFDRLTNSSLTHAGGTLTIGSNGYDQAHSGSYPITLPTAPEQHDALNYGTTLTVRGNLTTATGPGKASYFRYDYTGTVSEQFDGYGHSVQSTSSQANDYAVPSVIKPNNNASLQTTMQWNSFLGLTQETGPNGATGSVTYDANARPQTETSPHGAVTTYAYTNAPPTVTATTNGRWVKTTSDGFGRTVKVERGDGGGTKSIVETEYEPCACSPMGKVKRVTQPYAPGGTKYWTEYNYDGLGRTVSVVLPGGSGTTVYLYEGNTAKVTDPAGKWKKYEQNALGQVTKTIEPNPDGGADYETLYSYHVSGALSQVSMTRAGVTQVRSWSYNAATLRLESETHPETGTTTYTYNADGSPLGMTRANGKQLFYSYDALGRVSLVSDNGQGDDCVKQVYSYDTGSGNEMGRPSSVEVGGSGCASFPYTYREDFDYTVGGLVTKKSITVLAGGTPPASTPAIDVSYGYNNEGQATSLAVQRAGQGVPDFAYTVSYDGMGRPTSMTGSAAVSNVTYNAADQILSMTHGGLAETRQYNHLGQMTRLQIPGQMDLEYRFHPTANNGQITQMKNWISGEEVNYVYDSLSRLKEASTTGPEWGLQFGYDGFGNKLSQTVTKGSGPAMSVSVNGATNRITGHSYDSAGNTTAMPGFTNLSWDALGRMKTASVQSGPTDNYQYGADNLRVYRNGKIEVRGVGGELMGVYTINSGTLTLSYDKKYDYFGGRTVGKKEDRLSTVQTGSRFFPYGEEVPATANDEKKFATYYRDGNTGLDYAMQRYYVTSLGRFLSPDPYLGSFTLFKSGSANRYAYVTGDPTNAIDPWGLFELQAPPTGTFCDAWPSHPYCNPPPCVDCGAWEIPPPPKITDLELIAMEANSLVKRVKARNLNDCQALSFFMDFVAEWVDPDLFFDAFRVLLPAAYGGAFRGGGIQFQPGDRSVESGYQEIYRDRARHPRDDQGHHFAAFFVLVGPVYKGLAYNDAVLGIATAAVFLEQSNFFTNTGDIRLGIQAGVMGWQAATGIVPLNQVSSLVRRDLCKK